jgi:arginine repressor
MGICDTVSRDLDHFKSLVTNKSTSELVYEFLKKTSKEHTKYFMVTFF